MHNCMHKVNKLSENESQLAQRLAQEKRKILCPVLLPVLVFCLCRGLFTVKYELMLLYLCLGLCLYMWLENTELLNHQEKKKT